MQFRDRYEFLSNFYPVTVAYEGAVLPSVEHGYQAAKTTIIQEKNTIRLADTPGKAKRLGRRVTLRPGWNGMRVDVMAELVAQKFSKENPELRRQLDYTDDEVLVEHNHWHDNFWGSCTCYRCGDRGKNVLGKILMLVRTQIREEDWVSPEEALAAKVVSGEPLFLVYDGPPIEMVWDAKKRVYVGTVKEVQNG